MIAIASTWLALSLLLSVAAWFASRRLVAVFLPFAVIIAAAALYVPLGRPIPYYPKPGEYIVVGADIQVNIAIFVLLKSGDTPPVYYKLPYSNGAAGQLQAAQDAAAGQQGGVTAIIGQDGGAEYAGPQPVTGEAPKQAERPAINLQ